MVSPTNEEASRRIFVDFAGYSYLCPEEREHGIRLFMRGVGVNTPSLPCVGVNGKAVISVNAPYAK